MRIISGKYKGKRLVAPKSLPVRPTTDMQKEALFNILSNYYSFNDVKVLDLFSGTGNIAYEFASRGTQYITAIDIHSACVQFIFKTAKKLDLQIETLKNDAFKYLEKTSRKFDIIFADPPYDMPLKLIENLPKIVFEKERLTDRGMLIIEHSIHTDLSYLSYFLEQRKYGSGAFSFFEP